MQALGDDSGTRLVVRHPPLAVHFVQGHPNNSRLYG
jgi:hypothetical protein